MDETLVISFPDLPTDKANAAAEDLRKDLKRIAPTLVAERKRQNEHSQDFGATLAVVITSAAVTALAKGIANYMAKRATKITVKIGDVSIETTGVEGKDAAAIMKAIEKRPN